MLLKQREKLIEMVLTPFPAQPLIDRDELGQFVDAYIVCALWASNFDKYSKDDFEEAHLAQMIRDCLYFDREFHGTLDAIYWITPEYTESNAGHDFWLSRNHHGTGFFDRGKEPHWQTLQKGAEGYGERNLIVSDKGTIEMMEQPEYGWNV